MATRPRRHSVVTLRLTVAADDVFSENVRRDPSLSPGRQRSFTRSRHRSTHSPRTPSSPLCRSPTSPLSRTPSGSRPQTPVSPHSPLRRTDSPPLSPRSPRSPSRIFRYDGAAEQKNNLRRRSSLLTVPSAHEDHFNRRKRSSSIAGPLRPPPDILKYLNETAALERALSAATSSSSSSFSDEDTQGVQKSPIHNRSLPISPDHSVSGSTRRRHSNTTDTSAAGLCRLRQFSTTSRGRVVNRGDSLRPRRSASNTSVNSTISTASRDIIPSTDSNCTPTPMGSRGHSPNGSRAVTPSSTPVPAPKFYVGMVGSPGVGRTSIVTQFMTSEYMCAYDDSSDEGGSERSVSVVLDGEEAELIFVRMMESKNRTSSTSAIDNEAFDSPVIDDDNVDRIDAWVVIYSVSDKLSFREATAALGRVWSRGCVEERAVILVANKTDLERTRVVSTAEGRKLARTYECKFIEVSAGLAHHVDELLVGILVQIRLKQKTKGGMEKVMARSQGSIRRLSEKLKHKNSFRVKGFLGKILCRSRTTKSCENLHML